MTAPEIKEILDRAKAHWEQLAPHQKERRGGQLFRQLITACEAMMPGGAQWVERHRDITEPPPRHSVDHWDANT